MKNQAFPLNSNERNRKIHINEISNKSELFDKIEMNSFEKGKNNTSMHFKENISNLNLENNQNNIDNFIQNDYIFNDKAFSKNFETRMQNAKINFVNDFNKNNFFNNIYNDENQDKSQKNKYNKSGISFQNNNLIMNNNQYSNLISFNNLIPNIQNTDKTLLSNQYQNFQSINNLQKLESFNRTLNSSFNNIYTVPNFNIYSNGINNEVLRTTVGINNRKLANYDTLFNLTYGSNFPLQQIPFITNNSNFNSINKEQDTIKIDSLFFNQFDDPVKLNNNTNLNQINLLENKLNNEKEIYKCSINANNHNLINNFSNTNIYPNLFKSNNLNLDNIKNNSTNSLNSLYDLTNIQNNNQENYNKNSSLNINYNNENFKYKNNIFEKLNSQIKIQDSESNQAIKDQNRNMTCNFVNENADIKKTPKLIELLKEIDKRSFNNNDTKNESCDINKVLNCYLFLKKYNLLNDYKYSDELKEKFNSNEASEPNFIINNYPCQIKNISMNDFGNLNQNKLNNITNNYNYVLNNYNVNIIPREGSQFLNNIKKLVVEKEKNNSEELSNTKAKTNIKKKNDVLAYHKEKAFQIRKQTNDKGPIVNKKEEERDLQENNIIESNLKLEENDCKNNIENIVKLTKNPFCLIKNVTPNIKLDIKSKSENISEKNSISSNSSSKSFNIKIKQSKKINFKIIKEKEKKTLSKQNDLLKTEQVEVQNKNFNCFNEFYLDNERNNIIRKELEEYTEYYENDLAETLKDERHSFMKSHFPEMYLKKDNFYLNIKLLNKKRKMQAIVNSAYIRKSNYVHKNFDKFSYIDNFANDNTFFENCKNKLLNDKGKINNVYDIYFNLNNDNFKFNYKVAQFELMKYNILTDKKPKRLKRKTNYNTEIEIHLNSNLDYDSIHSEKRLLNKKCKTGTFKDNEEKNNFLNNTKYSVYKNVEGIKFVNTINIFKMDNFGNIIEPIDNKKEIDNLQCIFDKNNIDSTHTIINKIWDDKHLEHDKVDDYLFEIEKFWPFDEFHWSQEYALQFLMENNYDLINCKRMVKLKENKFLDFMRSKLIKKDNFLIKTDSRKPGLKYLLNN